MNPLKPFAVIADLVPWNVFLLGTLFPFMGMLYAQQPHQVALSWIWVQGTGGPADHYNVKRSTVSGGPYVQLASVPVVIQNYTDLSGTGNVLVELQQYCYIVTAANGTQESANSMESCGIIPKSITAPSSLSGSFR